MSIPVVREISQTRLNSQHDSSASSHPTTTGSAARKNVQPIYKSLLARDNAAAVLAAKRQRYGQVVDTHDTEIAAIVVARHAKLEAPNVEHCADSSAEVVNPYAQ
jgi:hypothetical protein